jgi:ATP-dependent Clp protease protease subunit
MMKDRVIILNGQVHDQMASAIIAQLMFLKLDGEDGREISMYINSPGGSVTAGLAIYDVMQNIIETTCPISTTVMGQAASMGSLLGCAGSAGKRYAMPNSRIMVHQPSGGAQGMASDIQIQAQEIQILKEQLSHMYVHHCAPGTGNSYEAVEAKLDRDTFMSAYEAKEFGLVDEIISHGTAHIAEKYGKRKSK